MDAKLWNIGVKVANVSAEVAFFVALGGRVLAHERLTTPQGEAEYALLEFGGTRLFLTPKPIFEDTLANPPPDGLTHAVFEVEHLEREVERLSKDEKLAQRLAELRRHAVVRCDRRRQADRVRQSAGKTLMSS